MAKYRKGSMGAADERNLKLGLIVFSILFFVVYLLFITNNGTFFHYYWKNAGVGWNITAIVVSLVHYWTIWAWLKDIDNPIGAFIPPTQLVLWGGFLLNIFLYAGWSFPLP